MALTLEESDLMFSCVVAYRNRFFYRGYTPPQLAAGVWKEPQDFHTQSRRHERSLNERPIPCLETGACARARTTQRTFTRITVPLSVSLFWAGVAKCRRTESPWEPSNQLRVASAEEAPADLVSSESLKLGTLLAILQTCQKIIRLMMETHQLPVLTISEQRGQHWFGLATSTTPSCGPG